MGSDQQLLVTLLVKVGVLASMSSLLVRSGAFKDLLFRRERTLGERLRLGAFLGTMFAVGVAIRVTQSYPAADVGLEGALLAGLLGGHLVGGIAGGLMALPAVIRGEWLSLPVLVLAGILGGMARRLAPDSDDVWHFSPFVDMNIYRWYQRRWGKPRGDWQMMFFLSIVALEIWYFDLGRWFPGRLFHLDSPNNWLKAAIFVAGILCVAIPIKIFTMTRNEIMLEEQHRLLVEARMEALTSQINPHFLFNTLNSISSLVRLDPEMARRMIQRLSGILRRLLRRQEMFTSLSEEISFIEDYLDIEVVRFGAAKLKIIKEVDANTLDMQVPSMLLQPIVENSIKHGLSPRLAGGVICLRTRTRPDGSLCIEVEDNGVGMAAGLPADGSGIGLTNVQERLKIIYGSDFVFRITSEPGQGTRVLIELPDLAAPVPLARNHTQSVS